MSIGYGAPSRTDGTQGSRAPRSCGRHDGTGGPIPVARHNADTGWPSRRPWPPARFPRPTASGTESDLPLDGSIPRGTGFEPARSDGIQQVIGFVCSCQPAIARHARQFGGDRGRRVSNPARRGIDPSRARSDSVPEAVGPAVLAHRVLPGYPALVVKNYFRHPLSRTRRP